MAVTESRGVAKLLVKIDEAMSGHKFYEGDKSTFRFCFNFALMCVLLAHQIYRTLYFRYSKQEKHRELLGLLLDGATRLLESGNSQSGSDLGLLVRFFNFSSQIPFHKFLLL